MTSALTIGGRICTPDGTGRARYAMNLAHVQTPIARVHFSLQAESFEPKLRCTVIAKERRQGLPSYVRHCISGIVGDQAWLLKTPFSSKSRKFGG
jgi:hypothetical protein